MSPALRLKDRNAIVTGGASGLGLAMARRFLEDGARVVIADINVDLAKRMAHQLDASGTRVAGLACDITDPAQCDALVQAAEGFFAAPLDLFVANAGAPFRGALADATPDQVRHTVSVNLLGGIFSVQAAIRSMRAQGRGVLLFTASVQGVMGRPSTSVYSATKHALVGLVKSLALELGPQGIRVNAVAPGAVDTPLLRRRLSATHGDPVEALKAYAQAVPLRRLATPDDVAAAAAFLASDDARCITGHTLLVDSGAAAGTETLKTN